MKNKVLIITILGILGIMLLVLTGCGNNNEGDKSGNNSKTTLASVVKVGDYVEYNAGTENTYTSPKNKNGCREQVFKTTGKEKWRVLSVEDNGTVNLVSDELKSESSHGFSVIGVVGYNNLIEELNNISAIYGKGDGAVSARSMTIEDILKGEGLEIIANELGADISKYTTDDEKINALYDYMSNIQSSYYITKGAITLKENFNKEVTVTSDKIMYEPDKNSENGYKETNSITCKNFYLPDVMKFGEINNDEELQKILFTNDQKYYIWLANSASMVEKAGDEKYISYNGFCGVDGSVRITPLFTSINNVREKEIESYIKTVVTLEQNIKTTGGDGTLSNPYQIGE